jgi:hypothetical protein
MGSPLRFAPCVPHWLMLQREAVMQIDDLIRKCVVFLGHPAGDRFAGSGTGFLVSLTVDEFDFRYIVSAPSKTEVVLRLCVHIF